MPIVLGLNRLRNRGCVSVWSHDRQLVYCLVTTCVAYIAAGYRLQPALAAAAATLDGIHDFIGYPSHPGYRAVQDAIRNWLALN